MGSRRIYVLAIGLTSILGVPEAPAQTVGVPYPPTQGAGLASGSTTLQSPQGGQTQFPPMRTFDQADTSPSRPAEFYTPFMLGDLVFPVGSYFFDLKVAEGNSPRPVDRVFLNFNYYNNLGKTSVLNPLLHEIDLYRYVFGFEKTLFDGKASLAVRIPFFTVDAQARDFAPDAGFTSTYLGNINATGKFVLLEDKTTGSLLSAGATISLPTASSRIVDPGPGTIAFVEAFGGFILTRGDLYFQGFTSMTVPLVQAESIVLFEDVGVGYFVYRNDTGAGMIRSVAPTFEMHMTIPLRQPNGSVNDFGLFDNLHVSNIVDFTLGATLEFSNRSTLGFGVCTPVTGPKPWDVEAIVQFNYRF